MRSANCKPGELIGEKVYYYLLCRNWKLMQQYEIVKATPLPPFRPLEVR